MVVQLVSPHSGQKWQFYICEPCGGPVFPDFTVVGRQTAWWLAVCSWFYSWVTTRRADRRDGCKACGVLVFADSAELSLHCVHTGLIVVQFVVAKCSLISLLSHHTVGRKGLWLCSLWCSWVHCRVTTRWADEPIRGRRLSCSHQLLSSHRKTFYSSVLW